MVPQIFFGPVSHFAHACKNWSLLFCFEIFTTFFSFLGSTSAASVVHSSGSSCVQALFFSSPAVLLLTQTDFKSPPKIPKQQVSADYFRTDKNTDLILMMKFYIHPLNYFW